MTFKHGLDRVSLDRFEDSDTYYASEYIMEDSAMYMDTESSSHRVATESEVTEIVADRNLRINHKVVDITQTKLDIICNNYLKYDLRYGHYDWITGKFTAVIGEVNNDAEEHKN